MNELIVLGNWEKAKQAIAECKTIDELKMIRDKAEALRAYAKQAKESLEVQNNVAEIKIRCERKIGEFSKELPKVKSNQHTGATSHDGKLQILKDAGIVALTIVFISGLNVWWSPVAFAILNGISKEINNYLSEPEMD